MNGTFTSNAPVLMIPAGQVVQQRTIRRTRAGRWHAGILLPPVNPRVTPRPADQSPKQAGQARAAITKAVQAVAQPGGKDIDWGRVGAVGSIVGAVTVIHGLKIRSWRYLHTAAVALVIGAAVAGRLKMKYAGTSDAPDGT